MRDHTLKVEVPATMLADLAALAAGYTMNRGSFISKQCINDAYIMLYDSGYETWDDEPIPEISEWYYGTLQ